MNIAIVGASGAVGQELLKVLSERHFPLDSLHLFGSKRSAGRKYEFNNQEIRIEELQHGEQFRDTDIVFTSAGACVSKEYAEDILKNRCIPPCMHRVPHFSPTRVRRFLYV